MKARLFVTAVLLGVFAGCAHQHDKGSHAETQVDEEALADELYHELCHDLEHPPYYASSIRWGSVFKGMVAIGVLPEEAGYQVRRSARSTVSAKDVDKLLDKHEADAEAFLDALDEAHVAAGLPSGKKVEEDEFPYGLPSEDAVERWHEVAKLVDRPPRCGNSLHWLPVYKDLMRLGFSSPEAQSYCSRAVLVGLSRFTAERLIDGSKRDAETFSEGFELAMNKAEFRRANVRTTGVKAFFKGKIYKPKKKQVAQDLDGPPAQDVGGTLETPQGDETPAESMGDEAPAEGMGDETPADGMGDVPPAEGMGDEPPAEGMGDEPPSDVPEGE